MYVHNQALELQTYYLLQVVVVVEVMLVAEVEQVV
jgi:hypothetical protein